MSLLKRKLGVLANLHKQYDVEPGFGTHVIYLESKHLITKLLFGI